MSRKRKASTPPLDKATALKRAGRIQAEASRSLRGMSRYAVAIQYSWKEWPAGKPLPLLSEFRESLEAMRKYLDVLGDALDSWAGP